MSSADRPLKFDQNQSSLHKAEEMNDDDNVDDLVDQVKVKVCAKGDAICIPSNYSKFDLPNETQTVVNVGIDIKDIPKIDDQEYAITLNAFFVVRWQDERMIIDQEKMKQIFKRGESLDSWIPVDVR